MGVNIAQMLRQGALRHPERTALVDVRQGQARPFSYRDLDAAACRVAGRLHAAGVSAGGRVGLLGENSAAFVASWFGVVYAGAAVVPVPILSAPPEVAQRVHHPGAEVLLTDGPRAPLARAALQGSSRRVSVLHVEDALLGAPTDPPPLPEPRETAPQDTAMVLYTSATTGEAKGAAISHAALMLHTTIMAQHTLRLNEDDVVMGVLPLTHSYGCRMVVLASFYVGARAVLCPRFRPEETLALLDSQGVTWLPAVPTMFAALGNLPAGPTPGRLRWALSAGSPLSDEVARRVEARLGVEVRQGFGMTEATFVSVNSPPDVRVLGSVGRPVWGVEVRIIDERGAVQPVGQRGEVLVRGHNMMSHYLDDRDATRQALSDGWMHTGDVGCLDRDGRLYIVDRIKDMILRGGYNVYPSELEDVIAGHPAVAEVAVVGRPDDYYGEEIVAAVVRRAPLSAAALHAWTAARLAKSKLPREVVFMEALPLGPSGKVLKRALRAQLADGSVRPERCDAQEES